MANGLIFWTFVTIIVSFTSKHAIEGIQTVEIRVDKLNALRYRPPQTTCCFTNQCSCSTKIRACLFDQSAGLSCPDGDLQTGSDNIGGLFVGRTQSVLFLDTRSRQTQQNLALRVIFVYGPKHGRNNTILGHYRLDITGLPLGPNRDEVGWATFDLNTTKGVTASLQIKMYCGSGYFGEDCSRQCVPVAGKYYCTQEGNKGCLGLWTGPQCDRQDPCLSYPCLNAGTCRSIQDTNFTCECNPLYTGRDCSMGINSCMSVPCHHTGTCIDLVDGFRCMCPDHRTGIRCETDITDCRVNGCQNEGRCLRSVSRRQFVCVCPRSYSGERCQNSVCQITNCQNGGRCIITRNGSSVCQCISGFTGSRCEERISPCQRGPCENGGRCISDRSGNYVCHCQGTGYKGDQCHVIDPCASSPCGLNGTCHSESPDSGGEFTCSCPPSFTGQFCSEQDPCFQNPCFNGGSCFPLSGGGDYGVRRTAAFDCVCQQGYSGQLCEVGDPCVSHPCLNGGQCRSRSIANFGDRSLSFTCSCRDGYIGYTCETYDVCRGSNPCRNGGSCVSSDTQSRGYFCQCAYGYKGDNCQLASPCISNPCINGGSCRDSELSNSGSYTCMCPREFFGDRCELTQLLLSIPNPCNRPFNPCGRHGTCHVCKTGDKNCGSPPDKNFVCVCSKDYRGSRCEERKRAKENCSTNPLLCRNGSVCIKVNNSHVCTCPSGVRLGDCKSEVSDPCSSKPCLNNGICTSILSKQNVHTLTFALSSSRPVKFYYRCTCPPGFTGKNCDLIDNCFVSPCLNGGTCFSRRRVGSQIDVGCKCAQGYTGRRCENKVSCVNVPCQNNGRCVISNVAASIGKAVCSCPPGFSGDTCENVSDCRRAPCLNGGMCVETDNFRGGIRKMACVCPRNFIGLRCERRIINGCKDGDCLNGGVCRIQNIGISDGETMFEPKIGVFKFEGYVGSGVSVSAATSQCMCRPGFTGVRCEVLVNPLAAMAVIAGQCAVNLCRNGGRCVMDKDTHGIKCKCLRGWTGQHCHIWEGRRGLCRKSHCSGRGVCYLGNDNNPTCLCDLGFGRHCEHSCASQTMGQLFPHPEDCSQYVMCVWGTPFAMRCPRQGLHFNPSLGLCDWPQRAGCYMGRGHTQYRGLWWKVDLETLH